MPLCVFVHSIYAYTVCVYVYNLYYSEREQRATLSGARKEHCIEKEIKKINKTKREGRNG